MNIGILALQGAVREHARAIEACGHRSVSVKSKAQLESVDALVLPGGESTAMRRLIDGADLLEPLRAFAKSGKPIFGTCAGLILLASKVDGQEEPHIGALDVTVERNSFGRQVDSFEAMLSIEGIERPFPAVFIRAPHIRAIGPGVRALCTYNGRVVMAQQGAIVGCSFHPELTSDARVMQLFLDIAKRKTAVSRETIENVLQPVVDRVQ